MINRRNIVGYGAAVLSSGKVFAASAALPSSAAARRLQLAQAQLRELELKAQGRLGVHLIDTATGQEFSHRADERFMMLSSFKLLACAAVLSRVDAGDESLDRRIIYPKQDLVTYSPVTEKHAGSEGMTMAQLCKATLTTSDNTAANLILATCGGPAALTALARKLGDRVTRLDHTEPELNIKQPGGLMNTTSPRAMALTMQKLLLGNVLSQPSRDLLQQWLLANTTGGKRLKAGLPPDWRIGDKTGTNKTDTNDIGVVWPPDRKPWLVTAYLADSQANTHIRESTMAHVGALVLQLAV